MTIRAGLAPIVTAPALALLLAGSGAALADSTEEAPRDASPALSFEIGMDWTSAYYFRGFHQESRGTILQPLIEVSIPLKREGPVTLTAVVGAWNSFHEEETGATRGDAFVRDWFELDLYGGLELADAAREANGGDGSEVVGRLGLSTSF